MQGTPLLAFSGLAGEPRRLKALENRPLCMLTRQVLLIFEEFWNVRDSRPWIWMTGRSTRAVTLQTRKFRKEEEDASEVPGFAR